MAGGITEIMTGVSNYHIRLFDLPRYPAEHLKTKHWARPKINHQILDSDILIEKTQIKAKTLKMKLSFLISWKPSEQRSFITIKATLKRTKL